MMEKHFIVGAFLFRVIAPEGFPIPENFLKFEQKQKPEEEPRNQTEPEEKPKPKAAEFTYRIDAADEIPQPAGSLIAERTGLQVYRAPGVKEGESRVLFFASPDPDGQPHCAAPYASYEEISEAEAQILVSRERLFLLQYDTGFTSLFALERQMIHHDGIILHCAYIVWHGHAILFSAPSQTGKSTQAALWEKYRGSRTINGDRALLRKIGGVWNACGWPVCGSSEICRLQDTPIRAVVLLRQGRENQVRRLTAIQAFTGLYPQVTINSWNKDFVRRAMDGIEDLIREVPVRELTCDISENAVCCLEQALLEEEGNAGSGQEEKSGCGAGSATAG